MAIESGQDTWVYPDDYWVISLQSGISVNVDEAVARLIHKWLSEMVFRMIPLQATPIGTHAQNYPIACAEVIDIYGGINIIFASHVSSICQVKEEHRRRYHRHQDYLRQEAEESRWKSD